MSELREGAQVEMEMEGRKGTEQEGVRRKGKGRESKVGSAEEKGGSAN